MPRKKKEAKPDFVPLEIPDRIEMNYRYSYGGISPFSGRSKKKRSSSAAAAPAAKKPIFPRASTAPNVTFQRSGYRLETRGP
ncbi:MAG: hypothetical protein MPW14_16685 [Candidatus Manganitrophus sp.]|nr:hypothetical protein [Candidatus Manganitrophus sp.]WDT69598.1 MAG: hypothetical protein MPW17_12475 [Candidatus Manganitrophus sp.]WDT78802.1 MAG: hypothetical protein MPW14_16685 [Candidatus Manganitrophus sp.]